MPGVSARYCSGGFHPAGRRHDVREREGLPWGACCDPKEVCAGLDCGDDGCGGSCGDCPAEHSCLEGICVPDCLPECEDKECGDDGCEGSCGECAAGDKCLEDEGAATCEADCQQLCGGKQCGSAGEEEECACGECDDGHACTDDSCTLGGVCLFVFNSAACDDGNPCTGDDSCSLGNCAGKVLPAEELAALDCICAADDDCEAIENGNVCDGTLYCHKAGEAEGVCQVDPSTILACDDSNPCTTDSCDPQTGCVFQPDNENDCSDGDACNGLETCNNGACLAGAPAVCDDENPCTDDACVPAFGCTYEVDDLNDCSDLNVCNGPEVCQGGGCQAGMPLVCDDNDKCTADTCAKLTGCLHAPAAGICEDNLDCTKDTCSGDTCFNTLQPYYCLIGGVCVPSGADNPEELCEKCAANLDPDDWTYLGDGMPCAPGKVCFQGGCCDAAGNCADNECGDDGCGGSCGGCPLDWSCQSGTCVAVPCDPQCFGKDCGPDGCDGNCGMCQENHFCSMQGLCICLPQCGGKECGDNGCNGFCGVCPKDFSCQSGICEEGPCVPQCEGKTCGTDGCGDVCGSCQQNEICTTDGECICIPDCDNKKCGPNGCGGSCGSCQQGWSCQNGVCSDGPCQPDCMGKDCGPDGCGDVCGTCGGGEFCSMDGKCICMPSCVNIDCGDDGCGGSCGDCDPGYECNVDGECICVPDCNGKVCGDNGCGGNCGSCGNDKVCFNGECVEQGGSDSCVGHCGGASGDCYCDELCFALDTCCADVCTACPDLEGCTCGNGQCEGELAENCSNCPADCTCDGCANQCVDGECVSTLCEGKNCGDDGCGGTCGDCVKPDADCVNGAACVFGNCIIDVTAFHCVVGDVCVPSGTENPDNSCLKCLPNASQVGWSNLPNDTPCGNGEACHDGVCCIYDCAGKQCGPDGCGGTCGTCIEEVGCSAEGQCNGCDDGNEVDWDGCTGGIITEFQVNGYWQGSQTSPKVAVLKDDRFAVGWSYAAGGDAKTDVHVRIFSADGSPEGVETVVPESSYGSQIDTELVPLPDGGFVVLWRALGQGTNKNDIYAQRYSAVGEKVGGAFVASPDSTDDDTAAQGVTLAPDVLLVLWNNGYTIRGQKLSLSGDPIGMKLNIASTNDPSYSLTQLDDGGFYVAAIHYGNSQAKYTVKGTFFDADGIAQGNPISLVENPEMNQLHPDSARLSNGNLVVTWQSVDSNNNGVFARRISPTGDGLDSDFLVNTTTNGSQGGARIAALHNGGFIVAWGGFSDGDNSGVHLQRFDSEGTKLGEETQVNHFTDGYQGAQTMATFSDSSFIVVWYGADAQDGNSNGIFAQRFNADGHKLYR